jgi:hypothetical protein
LVRKGQRIRLRQSSLAAREWGLPLDAEGVVICEYRLLADRSGACELVDVRFDAKTIVWGAPAKEFEPISESA